MDKVRILGGGPGAVYAYYGALDAGVPPERIEILVDRFNIAAGAFWLRESPVEWPSVAVCLVLLGTADRYSLRQWGEVQETSAHRYFQHANILWETAFDPYTLLPTLWSVLPYRMVYSRFREEEVQDMARHSWAVIQTFPRPQDAEQIVRFPVYSAPIPNQTFQCVYNGSEQGLWLRQTFVPGKVYVEFPRNVTDCNTQSDLQNSENERWGSVGSFSMVPDLPPEVKSLTWEERVLNNRLLVGRFAHLDRKFLSHQTRAQVCQFLKNLFQGGKGGGVSRSVPTAV